MFKYFLYDHLNVWYEMFGNVLSVLTFKVVEAYKLGLEKAQLQRFIVI